MPSNSEISFTGGPLQQPEASTDRWALVLAGGEGSRLRHLTMTSAGEAVPKQYCTINRQRCLLQDSLLRARAVTTSSRVCSVVAAHHEIWWRRALSELPARNIFVQPANRGTAFGVLLGLATLELRGSADDVVLILPADQFVGIEAVMAQSLVRLTACAHAEPETLFLLGAEPEGPDEGLGYIVPWHFASHSPSNVYSFVERPDSRQARRLINEGALWNTFIISATIGSLLRLYEPRFAVELDAFRAALRNSGAADTRKTRLQTLYEGLSAADFSKDILEQNPDGLRVLRMPACGWTDLGSAQRLSQAASAHYLSPRLTHEYLDLTQVCGRSDATPPG